MPVKKKSPRRKVKATIKRKTSRNKIAFYRGKTKAEILKQIGVKYSRSITAKKKTAKRKINKQIRELRKQYNKL